jgi:predicted phage tail protein
MWRKRGIVNLVLGAVFVVAGFTEAFAVGRVHGSTLAILGGVSMLIGGYRLFRES